ncbi:MULTISPECIES: anhydro-N-acetylmuramic acid kinase [unclassified Virgibacillus]|uniref:anhydro-N-acetylmuramic acid kinase n=1 Tax=unclassified Virgibacillus TaxID=2620237 RepID=UPI00090B25DD|nr:MULTISPECIES: anhydro-N-acetylmuramic acid kinase [unclassified Virgibacillus]API93420.1 anhydro-N-acetylmuramic acid kinase [Virgibacillus sp. 6R]MBS7430211.1 anhydro-N-acetylmuramic acid kinase [Virgibacillus sp. 19R1-5]
MLGSRQSSNLVVGLMSGTSLDGVDVAVVEIKDQMDTLDFKLLHFTSLSYSQTIRDKISTICNPKTASIEEISSMNMYLGKLFADASLKAIQEAGLSSKQISLISSHGQTIFHQPEPKMIAGSEVTSTLQIGDIGMIAEKTGIMTIGDFRTRDMAAGGQGAPLVPYTDYKLFRKEEHGRVLVNIGGISNVTILPKGCTEANVLAYDTGPGNMIIDAFTSWATNHTQNYDKNGDIAAKGKVNEDWLSQLLDHPYFQLAAPKSTGRELFGEAFAKRLWQEGERYQMNHTDKITTITALTAKTIAMEINKFIKSANLKEVFISGGGRYNKTLMRFIANYLSLDVSVYGIEEIGMSADAKEAISFAILGYQCYKQRTNNLPAATGANNEVIMGKIAW